MKDYKLINNFYKDSAKSENDWKELRKKLIFARACLCSSSLLQWGGTDRKEFVDEKKSKKIWELLTNSPDGIDNFYVKNFGSGSMNYLTEKRKNATDKQLEELMKLIQNTEKFIKEDLEKGTEFEGEFEKKFPKYIESEEEKWEHYKISKEVLNEEGS
ncbi:hypothetical protein [endosymbiont GvMRE of Glomus versiforme]|uniref:hypothetical protein n=1 Tax=endosymbiont GvMRE of Glomus versiforme TaxID=2039283 RepID=UPI000EDB2EB0|nr:hypothetical protein [endosymbiont GvMRE of Glomus versiforme]RHZ36000.1 hypothetical protein GvMRE_Ic3g102 [endosymbiont GvMRE of Glomus versiforme]